MSMISNAVITGGAFSQNINNQRQVYVTQTQKSALDCLKEAVAHTTFHNSGERFDPPKCHPNTRVAVRDRVEKWALRTDPDTRHASMLWLSGAAGAGKSAIAQTVAEDFHSRGILLASFFFGRSDPTRNHARSLVATIAYQLHTLLPPPEQSRVLAVIERDPLIFTRSLLAQFEALIVNPLRHLWQSWSGITSPRLIIIDGLDECLDHGMQRNVLLMLCASIQQFHLPFVFLLASRPEHDIQAVFSSPDFISIHTRLFLDDTYLPDHDIELFLRDQFEKCRTTHPFKRTIPHDWPSEDTVNEITRKSSGQFIYASIVAKYVISSRHRPHHRLDVVMSLRPPSRDLPFSELDALYTHIFSCVEDIERVLDVIGFWIAMQDRYPSVDEIECFLNLDSGELEILLCDLSSVIHIEKNPHTNCFQLKLFHASLADYLLDGTRSKGYFIDLVQRCPQHVIACLQFLSGLQCEHASNLTVDIDKPLSYFHENYLSLKPTESLYHAIKRISVPRIYHSIILNNDPFTLTSGPFGVLASRFLPALFDFLQTSDSEKHLELYQHHQSEYDLFLRDIIKTSLTKTANKLPLFLGLVANYRRVPNPTFNNEFCLFNRYNVDKKTVAILQLDLFSTDDLPFMEYLSKFLWDPKRSQEFCAGPKLFAQAAKYCLVYLCNHRALAQKALPRMSPQQRTRRKNTPWKWHRRVLREDIKGPLDTPWLWLTRPTDDRGWQWTTRIFRRKTKDLIYAHWHVNYGLNLVLRYSDPAVETRIHSEKYHLALNYLNYFLPKAAKLDELVHMCQTLTLAPRSQTFPRKSARARSNMHKYAAQWE